MPSTDSIVGSLPIEHSVDPNGSLSIRVPIQVPPAKLSPDISISYHSAVHEMSVLGHGWDLQAYGFIQRTPATVAQDNFSGTINYDKNDRYTLNGQRLMYISGNEYRFELEQWSKVVAVGSDLANPDSWIENLPNGTVRLYGSTQDSKALADGTSATRIWALAETHDPLFTETPDPQIKFSNYVSYSYTQDGGFLLLDSISYGGNLALSLSHQRKITFSYCNRDDIQIEFVGGSRVCLAKRLDHISASFDGKPLHTYTFGYDDYAPVTGITRLQTVTLSDASGASVSPLKFKWSDAAPTVFDSLVDLKPLKPQVSTAQIIPADVDGSGRTDLILASKIFHNESYHLGLDVYLADGKGELSTTPRISATGLRYPDHLLALDMTGNGKADLVHIVTDEAHHTDTITVLLSTEDGYKPQDPIKFKPEVLNGKYYSGDFQGNGNVGLVYLYKSRTTVCLVQFTSNGKSFSPLPAEHGPESVNYERAQMVIADFNGNGASDIFLISPAFKNPNTVCKIHMFESQGGYLKFRSGDPFKDVGDHIMFTDTTAFLSLPEQDGKTGLLLLARNSEGKLEFRTLRSTGKSFDPSDLVATKLSYSGSINLGSTTSMASLDLVNVFEGRTGTEVSVLNFFNGSFRSIVGVKQPPGRDLKTFGVNFADLRGIGRADCLFSIYNHSSKQLELCSLPCAGSVGAPADFIIGYTGGLGATLSVSYAPLTDCTIYTAPSSTTGAVTPYLNALSRTSSSGLTISSSGEPTLSVMGHTRTQLVHFPKFVVKELITCALPSVHPEVESRTQFSYTSGRVSFDGRGWLGFETIVQRSCANDTTTTNTYIQNFPFVGQPSKTEVCEASTGKTQKTVTYGWKSQSPTHGSNCYLTVPAIQENSYEKGSPSYSVDVSHRYDSYANITETTITTAGKPSLITSRTYDNDADKWIIGSQLSESVTSDGRLMKRSKHTYLPGTQVINQIAEMVSESYFSVQDLSFDGAGNVIKAVGSERAQKTFAYDSTYSFPTTATVFTDEESSLTTSASYDYGVGQAISVTEYNGHIKTQRYDVLGRVTEIAEGDSLDHMVVIGKRQYTWLDGHAVCIHDTLCDLSFNSWSREIDYLDGMKRTWKKATPGVSNPSATVFQEVLFDGAGRIARQYRDYTNETSEPLYISYRYDSLSRKLETTSPATGSAKADPVTIMYDYEYSDTNHETIVKQTKSGGDQTSTTSQTVLQYFPNPDTTPGRPFVVPLTVSSIDELGHAVTTTFDALHRAVEVRDPSGVCLSQELDGILRQTSRKISNSDGSSISHFSILYEDSSGKTTITNELTTPKTKTVLLKDRLHRLIKRTAPDEEVLFTYDTKQLGAQGRLASVTSANGVNETFSYDTRGCKQHSSFTVDGQTFETSFEYNTGRQLTRITNPNGSILTKTFFENSNVVKHIQLQDAGLSANVSASFSDFDNPFFLPQVCDMGNGLKSSVTLADNGCPVEAILSKSGTTVHQQRWKLDGFGRLDAYNSKDIERTFQYTPGGQLISSQSATDLQSSAYSYDQSGNILSKDGNSHHNQGWQLSSIKDLSEKLLGSFEYSVDGHLMTEKDGSGTPTRTMTYDSAGQMTSVNSTIFTYDSNGRMVKAVNDDSVTYYPSTTYEVTIKNSKATQIAYLVHQNRRASITTVVDSEESIGSRTSVLYYHADHLGSVVAVSDENGNIITTYLYDPYGTATCQGPDSSRYKYSGKEAFEGLYYFGARFYDPLVGRFTTLDNITCSLKGITPSIFNQYTFSRNDPVNFIDFNGNSSVLWHWLWHAAVDVLLMAGGILVDILSGGTLGVLGDAMFGAGFSGAVSDITAAATKSDLNDNDWGISLGVGAISGLVGFGVGAVVEKMGISAVEVADIAAMRVGGKFVMSAVKDVARSVAVDAVIQSTVGAGSGVSETMLINLAHHRNLEEGLGQSAEMGAALGPIGGLLGGKLMKSGIKSIWKIGKAAARFKIARIKGNSYEFAARGSSNIQGINYRPIAMSEFKDLSHLDNPTSSVLSGQSNFF